MMKKQLGYCVIIAMILVMAGCGLEDITDSNGEEAVNAIFTLSENTGETPLTVEFDGSQSNVVNGTIQVYSWNYGDGSNGTGITSEHTYLSPGNYTISLTVTDSNGNSDVASKTLIVTAGAELFVDAGYSGTTSTGSETEPFKTISEAMSVASDGQSISVKAGTYNETFTIKSGVKLIGENAETTIIEPNDNQGIIIEDLVGSSEIKNFTIRNGAGDGIRCKFGADVTISGCVFKDNKFGIRVVNNADPVIKDCTFSGNEKGIYVENNSEPEVNNCDISGNYDGIVIDNNASPSIINSRIRENENIGVKIENYSTPTLDGNEITLNAKRGVNITIYSNPFIANNTIESNTEFDLRCGDEYSDFEDQGGNEIENCNGCESCGNVVVMQVAGRYEGDGTTDTGSTVLRALEIEQNDTTLTIKIFNQDNGVIPSNPNDSGEVELKAGQTTVKFTSADRGDEWEMTFGEGGSITGKQVVAANGKVVTFELNKV